MWPVIFSEVRECSGLYINIHGDGPRDASTSPALLEDVTAAMHTLTTRPPNTPLLTTRAATITESRSNTERALLRRPSSSKLCRHCSQMRKHEVPHQGLSERRPTRTSQIGCVPCELSYILNSLHVNVQYAVAPGTVRCDVDWNASFHFELVSMLAMIMGRRAHQSTIQ